MRYKEICVFMFLYFFYTNSCSSLSHDTTEKEVINMVEVCDLPESISEIEKFFSLDSGRKISSSFIDEISNDFELVKDKTTKDLFYSKEEDVRLVALSKKCKAPDGVTYEWLIAATVDGNGFPIFHQIYLQYRFEDIFNGLRKFSFSNIFGGDETYEKLISKETVGILNDHQFNRYMEQLGCIRVTSKRSSEAFTDEYYYEIIAKNDMASRLALWDFSKKIIVSFNSKRIVTQVTVR